MADTITPATKPRPPENGFALAYVAATGACHHCRGVQRIEVHAADGVIGTLVSEYRWSDDIPEDPTQHPDRPHYLVEWSSYDTDGVLVEADVPCLFFAADHLLRRHQRVRAFLSAA